VYMETETVVPPHKKKFLTLIVLVVVIIFVVLVVNQKRNVAPTPTPQVAELSQEPQKIDFGTNMPTDFPTDIPVEKGVKVEQSYSLNYAGQKQLTIVFLSTKTVKENYTLYADFLKKQNWNISNKYESANVSSLYGTKESNDINVTISENISAAGVKSQVSISVLKK